MATNATLIRKAREIIKMDDIKDRTVAITHITYRAARASLVEEARKLRSWRSQEPERSEFISAHLRTVQLQIFDLRRWPRRAQFIYEGVKIP
jgi:hypothetical protein